MKMPTNEIEKQYKELSRKFKLPDFKALDFEFEISDLEETNFLLREIMRRIAERLDFYTTFIEEVLQPDASSLYSMHETRFFDDDEKKQMYDLYRKLMHLNRHTVELSLEHDDEEEANFINKLLNDWKEIKQELVTYIKKMKDSWEEDTDTKENVGYMG